MIEHRSADPSTSRRLGGMHGLQLGVTLVEPLERRDAKKLTVEAKAEEGDSWIAESLDVKGMDVLGRSVRVGKRQMLLEELANVFGARVVDRDLALRHAR
jgi:hypothetical protein